jgi:DsbC/DsbD-like thiol-disulfide interchange protein
MDKRKLLLSLALAPLAAPAAWAQVMPHYKAELLSGGRRGDQRLAGLRLRLDPGWKTYWRMPGDSGVPPQFDWSGSKNLGAVDVEYPLPHRFTDAAGDAIGYHDEVVFPLSLAPADPAQDVELALTLFFAICKDICIPRTEHLAARWSALAVDPAVASWQGRVPRRVTAAEGAVITGHRLVTKGTGPALLLGLTRRPDDIFVESATPAYFAAPEFSPDGGEATLPIANVKDVATLHGAPLTATLVFAGAGIEQALTLD